MPLFALTTAEACPSNGVGAAAVLQSYILANTLADDI